MACVWAHGPDIHLDSRAYQIDANPRASREVPAVPRRKVLLVDDDHDLRGALADLLVAEGYSVTTFASGIEALQASPETFDAVILDLKMPVMSGEEFKRALDARGISVPVILMSNDDRVGDRASTLGCFDYLHKSADFDQVHSMVVRAVAERDVLSGPSAVVAATGTPSDGGDE